MFATRTSKLRVLVLVAAAAIMPAVAAVTALPHGAAAADPKFKSPQDALKQGIGAFVGGYYEIAHPALEAAAAANLFLGQYYLARLYADNAGSHTDHPKAYMLYQRLSNDHSDVDPDDDSRAPFVAKSLTALAGYVRSGLPEIALKPNPGLAEYYLRHTATFFNDEDAQFELAKLYLYGDPEEISVAQGKHWLSTLSQKGHAGGQAVLAMEQWRGKILPRDPVRALSLIAIALENAPPADRVWIEDIYQNIYCGAGASTRKQATGLVADWRDRYGRKPVIRDRSGLGVLSAEAVRTCQNGEAVAPVLSEGRIEASAPAKLPPSLAEPQMFLKGGAGEAATGLVPSPGPASGRDVRDISTPTAGGNPQER
ncbi:MAG: sel1 repeat family protein [Hyphomicrobium sp.]